MTNPTIATINPSKSKTYVALLGSVLAFAIPLIVSIQDHLPDPWPAVIGAVIAVLTALGVWRSPYKPEGTSVVSNADLREVATPMLPVDAPVSPPPGGWRKPPGW